MNRLRSIVYVSTATHALSTPELEALLTSARAFNLEHRVTGVLLFSGSRFMQNIEGMPDAVQQAYDRVRRTSQHEDLVEYLDAPIPARTFGSWQMGLARPTESELLTLSSAAWTMSTQQAFSPETPVGLGLLRVFWSLRQASP